MTHDDKISSSVHPQETSDSPPSQYTYRNWLRASDPRESQATDELLRCLHTDVDDRIFARYQNCRKRAYFMRNNVTGEVAVSSNHCHHRWCLPCSRRRSSIIADNVADWVKSLTHPKLLTLTLRSTDAPLRHQLKHLLVFFRRLRAAPLLKKAWRGGIWFVQTTWNDDKVRWHPHLHVLLDGDYVDQRAIKKLWTRITHGSSIVDIRGGISSKHAAKYVARYTSRPAQLADLPIDLRLELAEAFRGKRLYGSFGTARCLDLSRTPQYDRSQWTTIGSWQWVVTLKNTDERAHQIWTAWREHDSLPPDVTLSHRYYDDELPDTLEEPEPPPTQMRLDYND